MKLARLKKRARPEPKVRAPALDEASKAGKRTVLIDASRSSRGWSRIGTFIKCPFKFALDQRLGIRLIPAAALTKGSLGHLLQAHQHAIWGAEQGGCWVDNEWVDDPDTLMLPEQAAIEWCRRNPEGVQYLQPMLEVFDDYMMRYPKAPKVLAVEHEISGVLGTKPHAETGEPVFGLWLEYLYDEVNHTMSVDEDITPTLLNCPGHPDHDKPIRLTRRIDLTTEERGGAVIWDHKHTSKVDPARADDAYAMDGGFTAFRILGRQRWRNFSGLGLQLISNRKPYRVARPMIPETPHKDINFARMIYAYEHQVAQMDMMFPDAWDWPMAMNETVCMGRYGMCAAASRATPYCFYGSAVAEGDPRK